MGVYDSVIAMALRLINKYGMDATILSPVIGAPVVAGQAWKPTNGIPVGTPVRIVAFPEETIDRYSQLRGLVNKEDYQVGYDYYLMGNNGFIPALNQVVVKPNLEEWRIKYSKEYAPGGITVLWVIGMKR